MILKSTDIRKIAHISTYTSNFSESMAKQFRNQIRFSVQCKFDVYEERRYLQFLGCESNGAQTR